MSYSSDNTLTDISLEFESSTDSRERKLRRRAEARWEDARSRTARALASDAPVILEYDPSVRDRRGSRSARSERRIQAERELDRRRRAVYRARQGRRQGARSRFQVTRVWAWLVFAYALAALLMAGRVSESQGWISSSVFPSATPVSAPSAPGR